jgi:hypothetical protein
VRNCFAVLLCDSYPFGLVGVLIPAAEVGLLTVVMQLATVTTTEDKEN